MVNIESMDFGLNCIKDYSRNLISLRVPSHIFKDCGSIQYLVVEIIEL